MGIRSFTTSPNSLSQTPQQSLFSEGIRLPKLYIISRLVETLKMQKTGIAIAKQLLRISEEKERYCANMRSLAAILSRKQ